MNPTTVLYILDLSATIGVSVWLDGGWGVDALLGRISRAHNDLDLILTLEDLPHLVEALLHHGFTIEAEELGRTVLVHPDYGRIDLHPAAFNSYGDAIQVQPADSPVVYPRDGFVSGQILGRSVACISADVQVVARLGHDPSEKHRQDVLELCSAFELPIPKEWVEM